MLPYRTKTILYLVYLLEDVMTGEKYIGTTTSVNFYRRMRSHSRGRFKDRNFSVQLLECGTNPEIFDMEETYVTKYDTYNNGLNLTRDGKPSTKHRSSGYKFSNETRKKMSDIKKRDFKPWNKGKSYKMRPEVSEFRKGKQWGPTVLTEEKVVKIIELYLERAPLVDDRIGKIQRNGRPFSYEHAFAQKYGEVFEISSARIRQIITKRGWAHVWERYSKQQ